jgi:hypothetical protein
LEGEQQMANRAKKYSEEPIIAISKAINKAESLASISRVRGVKIKPFNSSRWEYRNGAYRTSSAPD